MDFLTKQEVSGLKQDIKLGEARNITEKTVFEQKLLDGLGEEMKNEIENPDIKKNNKFAKKANRKKRRTVWKENLRRIFGTKKEAI